MTGALIVLGFFAAVVVYAAYAATRGSAAGRPKRGDGGTGDGAGSWTASDSGGGDCGDGGGCD